MFQRLIPDLRSLPYQTTSSSWLPTGIGFEGRNYLISAYSVQMQSRNHEKLWSDSIFRGFFVFSLYKNFCIWWWARIWFINSHLMIMSYRNEESAKKPILFFFFCGAQNSSNAVSWAFFFFKFKELSLLGFQKMKYDNIRWRVSQHFAYYQPPFFLPLNDACFITCFLSMLNY